MIKFEKLSGLMQGMKVEDKLYLSEVVEKVNNSLNCKGMYLLGYQCGSPIFVIENKEGKYMIMFPAFYEEYEHDKTHCGIEVELSDDKELKIYYDKEIYSFCGLDELDFLSKSLLKRFEKTEKNVIVMLE